jgi:hypothetical protein
VITSLGAALASACVVVPDYRVHHALLDGSIEAPRRVVLLPADVNILRLSASAVDSVPELSRKASEELTAVLSSELSIEGLEVVAFPPLSEDERAAVQEHVWMFHVAADASLPTPLDVQPGTEDLAAWWHKIQHFDLSVGPGLSFLAERTGCSAGVMVAGSAAESTGGRKWLTFFAQGYAPTSATDVFLGMVDLRTGDLLWVGEHADLGDWLVDADALTEREDLRLIVRSLLERYPGIEEYRAASKPD